MKVTHGAAVAAIAIVLSGCGATSRGGAGGSEHTVRLQLPPDRAAACFARNAEEHSSALVAEVRQGREHAEVVVRVKNGVLYGTGDFRRAGSGSTATLTLMVMTSGRRGDLVDALVEGC